MTDIDTNGVLCATEFSDVHPWYVVHCKAGREKYSSEILRINLGLTTYVPEKKIWNKGEIRDIPLFPGYFFLQADLHHIALSQINTSPGVLSLLAYSGIPQRVPAGFIEALSTEIIRLNDRSIVPLRPGDTVYVVDGPLCGLEAVFVGPSTPGKRVQVLLSLLGRLTKTEVAISHLGKSREAHKIENKGLERLRYTRGKRRKTRNHEKNLSI